MSIDTVEVLYSDTSTWWFYSMPREKILAIVKRHKAEFNVTVVNLKVHTIDGRSTELIKWRTA